MLYLDYRAAERAGHLQRTLVVIAETVNSEAETDHVHLEFSETLYARSIEDMSQRLVPERGGQTLAHLLEEGNLAAGEIVMDILVGGSKMGIKRFHLKVLLNLHESHQAVQLLLHETKTVHAGVEGDMDRIIAAAGLGDFVAETLQSIHRRDARLELVLDHFRIALSAGGKHQYGQLDAILAQTDTLDGGGDAQIVDSGVLKQTGELSGSVAIRISLDHHQHLCAGFQFRTVISIVVEHRTAAHFQLRVRNRIFNHVHILQM